MQDSVNNPQAKPEIYLERSGAKDGPSQAGNMMERPALDQHGPSRSQGRSRNRSRTGGGGVRAEPRGAESWLGLRAAPLGITNNLTAGIVEPCPQISKTKHRPVEDMTLPGAFVFWQILAIAPTAERARLVEPI